MTTILDPDMIRQSREISEFAAAYIRPSRDVLTSGQFPHNLWRDMGNMGLLGLTIDRKFGGRGGCAVDLCVAGEALAREGENLGIVLSWVIHHLIAHCFIEKFANESIRRSYLPALAEGRITASLAASEPETMAHPKYMKTKASMEGDNYILNGEKTFITNGPIADVFLVVAVTSEEATRGFTTFIVPKQSPGLKIKPKIDLPFLRPCLHNGIILENTPVPRKNIVGKIDSAYTEMVLPFRQIEDTAMMGPLSGAMRRQLEIIASMINKDEAPPEILSTLGKLNSLSDTLRIIAYETSSMIENPDTHPEFDSMLVSFRNLGALYQEWLAECIALAGITPEGRLARLTDDIVHTGRIASGISAKKQRRMGIKLLGDNHDTGSKI